MFVPDGRGEVGKHRQGQGACKVSEATITSLIMLDMGSGTTEETVQS